MSLNYSAMTDSESVFCLIALALLLSCACYLLYRLDRPLYSDGRAFYSILHYRAKGYTEGEILRAILRGVTVKQSKRKTLYLCELEFKKLVGSQIT